MKAALRSGRGGWKQGVEASVSGEKPGVVTRGPHSPSSPYHPNTHGDNDACVTRVDG